MGRLALSALLLYLLSSGSSLGSDPDSLLIEAAKVGEVEAVERLLREGADPESADASGGTPLMWASKRGHVGAVVALLMHGVHPDQTDPRGWTPLAIAASQGEAMVMVHLLHAGADAQNRDTTGTTPLMRAAERGSETGVKVLVKDGKADVEAVNHDGLSARDIAEAANHDWENLLEGPLYLSGPGPPPGVDYGMLMRPVPLEQPPPVYPMGALPGMGGRVFVEFVVGRDGRTRDARVMHGPEVYREAALDAVRKWRYRPAIQRGDSIAVRMTVPFVFRPRELPDGSRPRD